MENSETGYAGSLPDQIGILQILYLLSPAFVEDSKTGYAGSLPDQLGILHTLSLSLAKNLVSDTQGYNGKLEQSILTPYNHIVSVDNFT